MKSYWNISAPITVHVEITEKCNERCKHCYNFSRDEKHKPREISQTHLDNTVCELKNNKVMHVIITGGEPLLALDKTLELAKRCKQHGISTSLNTNLVAATAKNMEAVREAGIEHLLTTLHGHNAEVHDYLASTEGAFDKIVRGIAIAQGAGIRVTVNQIILQPDMQDVYHTGGLVKALGVKKFLANRCIPSPTNTESGYLVGREGALRMFDDLLRVKRDFDLEVGTCRMVPECLFDEPDKYAEFVGRGCSAGRRHMLLNVDGTAHACVHESRSYGNIHDIGIKGCWDNMHLWRDNELIPNECQDCVRLETCEGGCRMVGYYCEGNIMGKDNLSVGNPTPPSYSEMQSRKEEGFYIVRIKGGQVKFVDA